MRKVEPGRSHRAPDGADGGVQSVRRALMILRILAEERRSLGVTDMVHETGLPQATVHRLLATLVDQGWVERSPHTSRYRFGPGILGTTAVALAHAPLLERARPLLARLAASFELDSYLSALVGRRVVFLERAPVPGSRTEDFHPGIRQPAHCTAAGKALLAFLPEVERHALYRDRNALRRYASATITEPAALEAELTGVRAAGYAEDHGEFVETWRSIAAPVFSADGAVAALSCGGSAARMTPEKLQALRTELVLAAEDLSHQLGMYED
jgi:DNA-binding IclR family transcriptional regulator